MLFEAFLSFLGLGVEAPDVSWGLLAKEGIEVLNPVKIYWWLVLFPSLALGATLLALNFLGDGLRDALDPRMKDR
jgi:oligopeptide transport system permease protein